MLNATQSATPKKTRKRKEIVLAPQPGPQTMFLETDADIAIYGGAAGGGKTYAALLDHVRWCQTKGYKGLILRRIAADITGPGSIWDEAHGVFGITGAVAREGKFEFTWPDSGAKVAFGHCQHRKDLKKYQGKAFDVVTFEEATHFEERQFWYLLSRLRSRSGIKPYLRATCNPDPDSFIRKLIDWWIDPVTGLAIRERSGVKRWFVRVKGEIVWGDTREEVSEATGKPLKKVKSLTFISAKLSDNPAMYEADPDYESNLEVLHEVERAQLQDGNWNIRLGGGTFFNEKWFNRLVDERMLYAIGRVRGWDLAATKPHAGNDDPDWTRGVLLARDREGRTRIEDCVGTREGPTEVEALMERTAMFDGKSTLIAFFQDPAQAGKSQAERLKLKFAALGYEVVVLPTSPGKIAYAKPLAIAAKEGYDRSTDKVTIVAGTWTAEYIGEHHMFPDGGHDDCVDATSAAYTVLEKRFPYAQYSPPKDRVRKPIYRERVHV